MKQILEVGGILVMPVNDHLLQIRRVEENNWTINSVLSVSFASLLLPAQEIAENITLRMYIIYFIGHHVSKLIAGFIAFILSISIVVT